jgi:hypothetical protein
MDKTFNLIKFLADGLIEDKVWFLVPSLQYNTGIFYEVQFTRKDSKPWAFRPKDTNEWTSCSTLDVLDALNEHLVDVQDFYKQLCHHTLVQAIYMNTRMRRIRELLGDMVVVNAIKEYDDFGNQLMDAANKALGVKAVQLTLVKND